MSTIRQSVEFPVPPRTLYETYMDSDRHGAAVGGRASIGRLPGTRFWVFAPDAVRGRTLHVVPGRAVVQAWRGQAWRDSDPDSILVLSFLPSPRGGRVELLQTLVPEHARELIAAGWRAHYWRPWRARLRR